MQFVRDPPRDISFTEQKVAHMGSAYTKHIGKGFSRGGHLLLNRRKHDDLLLKDRFLIPLALGYVGRLNL